jgi:glutaredoxin
MEEEQSLIIVNGASWCPDAQRTRRFLDDHNVAYQWRDVDRDPAAKAFVKQANRGEIVLPTVVFPDGSLLVEPTNAQLAEKIGISAGD